MKPTRCVSSAHARQRFRERCADLAEGLNDDEIQQLLSKAWRAGKVYEGAMAGGATHHCVTSIAGESYVLVGYRKRPKLYSIATILTLKQAIRTQVFKGTNRNPVGAFS